MKRVLLPVLLLATVGAFASNDRWRDVALAQLRSVAEPLFGRGQATQPQFDSFYAAMVEDLPPQARAERALELSINRFAGASDYVLANAQHWRGQIERNPRLTTLITTAINAPLIEIRMAGFELHLAQYDLDKSAEQVDLLIGRLDEDPEGAGPWALWSMAVIGARGVDRERVFDELLMAADHRSTRVRRWAVDSLAKLGGVEIVEPLLSIAIADHSPIVRERAFCGLAQSGTLHVAERYEALPGLLAIARDPRSDAQTLEWTYQALREISNLYHLPDDSDIWEQHLLEAEML
jgi:HEAT repeat protein